MEGQERVAVARDSVADAVPLADQPVFPDMVCRKLGGLAIPLVAEDRERTTEHEDHPRCAPTPVDALREAIGAAALLAGFRPR